jgi:two-component system sensor histidine kinase RegB
MTHADQLQSLVPTPWRPLRLDTLVTLRWLAIAGQSVGICFVAFALGFALPLIECLGIVAVSAVVNLAIVLRFGSSYRPSVPFATGQLIFDCLELSALLGLTGGLHNPFSILLLAPVSVSATILPQRSTVLLAFLVMALASLLWVFHLPLPWDPDSAIVFDNIYVFGLWVSLLCGVGFIAAYTNRVALEARRLTDALAATELALSRHEQLSALDGLAAAAAHELGTPLSTIALAAKEMRADLPAGPLVEDVDLIIGQTARCRAILGKLRMLGSEQKGDPYAAVPLTALIAEVAKPHEHRGKDIRIEKPDRGEDPIVRRNVGLLYGLGNLIENAVHYAERAVTVEIRSASDDIEVVITDDGPGYPPELLDQIGEPYLTSRGLEPESEDQPKGGLGLGIFIAKTLIERTGAELRFRNSRPKGGAEISIHWSRNPALPPPAAPIF